MAIRIPIKPPPGIEQPIIIGQIGQSLGWEASQTMQSMNKRRRLPVKPPVKSTFGDSASSSDWSFGVNPQTNPLTSNPLTMINPPTQTPTFQNAAGAGMDKSVQLNPAYNPNITDGFSSKYIVPEGAASVFEDANGNPIALPNVLPATPVSDTFEGTYTNLENPVVVSPATEGAPGYTLSSVNYYDPTLQNADEMIKSFLAGGEDYTLPGDWAGNGMTQDQWDSLESQAPPGYHYTPWGWVSDSYINSLNGTAGAGGYDYGGYSWGGGGGGRSKMDQFYFGLMNWGI
jgi:hypothetical protein